MTIFPEPPIIENAGRTQTDGRTTEVRDLASDGAPVYSKKLAKKKFEELVPDAINTVKEIMDHGNDKEDNLRLKAALAVLDRNGYGTHATITVEEKRLDLSQTDIHDLRKQLNDRIDNLTPAQQTQVLQIMKSESSKTIH